MSEQPTRTTPRRRSLLSRPVVTWLAGAGVVALAVGLVLFQPWRLLTRSVVDEPLPVVVTAVTTPKTDTSATSSSPSPAPNAPVRVLGEGRFVDGEHATSGTARVLELADGTRLLRLEGFSTSDGPDVDVWLTDQPAGGDDWRRYDDGRYVALGDLKGTDGNQNYVIPADADLGGLTSVVIWCDRFDVAFGTAPVRPA
ncbi:DM13 domain-containing protein [Terrabacter sp. GCM10028922]|uniref:DM13 domain-containing protein n=1 Tax=Terrabacter sp. GCM10028922 TaxID=3273428 RepID=UPI00360A19ED